MVEPIVLTKAELPCSAQNVSISEKKLVLETVKRLLDKHAVEKFSLLKDLVIDAEMIRTLDILLSVTEIIFEKAVSEPEFCHFYAQLCSDLIEKIPPLPSEELDGMVITVSQILVHNFQKILECTGNLIGDIGKMNVLDQEHDCSDKIRLLKARLLGSISLLGELFKKKIFKKRIVHYILKQLLEYDNEETHIMEANVEAICILFNSIGNQLYGHPQFNVYFDRLNDLAIHPQIELRWRHILCDILDQRANTLIREPDAVETTPAQSEAGLTFSARQVNSSDKEWVLETVQRLLDRQIPQKFGVLANLLINAEMITTPDILEDVTKIIFEKAVLDPDSSPMYAALSSRLTEEILPFTSNQSDGKKLSFKRILLNRCQEAFEDTDRRLAKIVKMTNQDQSTEKSDNIRMVKQHFVGTVCLIGELYKQKQVTNRILHHIIMKLANENDDTRLLVVNMEAICRLFDSIGSELDGHPFSDVYLNRLKELALMPKVEPQWRLMLHKILDKGFTKRFKGEAMPRVKTRICNKYFTLEVCRFGDKCSFAHGERELGRLIPSCEDPVAPQAMKTVLPHVKTHMCNRYITAEGCKMGDLCSFAHGEMELGRSVQSYDSPVATQNGETVMPLVKTRICNKYNTSEGCKYGNKCSFAHGEKELGSSIIPHTGPVTPHVVESVMQLPRGKTRICNKYSTSEGCRYGDACNFAHGERELGKPIPSHDSPTSRPWRL